MEPRLRLWRAESAVFVDAPLACTGAERSRKELDSKKLKNFAKTRGGLSLTVGDGIVLWHKLQEAGAGDAAAGMCSTGEVARGEMRQGQRT